MTRIRTSGQCSAARGSSAAAVFSACTASLALAVSIGASPCHAATILTKVDMRLWQTVEDNSVPLSWPWEDAADSATLVFSNRVTRSVSSADIVRGAGETHGHCAHPLTQAAEAIVDVALSQKTANGCVIVRETATLAYVPGAGGGPITVWAAGTRKWRQVYAPRVYAYDPAWLDETGESSYDIAPSTCTGCALMMR